MYAFMQIINSALLSLFAVFNQVKNNCIHIYIYITKVYKYVFGVKKIEC